MLVTVGERAKAITTLKLLAGLLIHRGETSFQAFKESGRPATSKSFLWLCSGGSADHLVVLYGHDPARSQGATL